MNYFLSYRKIRMMVNTMPFQDPVKKAIVVPLLATVLEQLSNGGGAKAVTVDSVS